MCSYSKGSNPTEVLTASAASILTQISCWGSFSPCSGRSSGSPTQPPITSLKTRQFQPLPSGVVT
ncbi:MAG: hypothetical protein ACYTXC_17625 [Nostoc sp.]